MKEIHHAQAADLIAAERKRQREEIGYTEENDDRHVRGELRSAAECYFNAALNEKGTDNPHSHPIDKVPSTWPWSPGSWRPFSGKVRMLTKAGALYVAEKERLERKVSRDAYGLMIMEIVEERIREVTEELNKALAPPTEERFRDHGSTFFNLRELNIEGGGLTMLPEAQPRSKRPLNSVIITKDEYTSLEVGKVIKASGIEFTVLLVNNSEFVIVDPMSNYVYSKSPLSDSFFDQHEVRYIYDYDYTVEYNKSLNPGHFRLTI